MFKMFLLKRMAIENTDDFFIYLIFKNVIIYCGIRSQSLFSLIRHPLTAIYFSNVQVVLMMSFVIIIHQFSIMYGRQL